MHIIHLIKNSLDNIYITLFICLLLIIIMAKKGIHPEMKEVTVQDIHGYEFTVYSTTDGPIKVESSHLSHPVYNPDKVQKKVSLGRSQIFAEKMARMQEASKKT